MVSWDIAAVTLMITANSLIIVKDSKMSALPKEDQYFTYADYKEWKLAEGERYELILGEAYAMAAPSLRHQEILVTLSSQFFNYLRGKPCKVYPAPVDVRLFYENDERDDTVVQPDIIVICDEKKRGTEGCRGAPELVIEILSPSNTAIEMERKLQLYLKAGVKEYWIVIPEDNRIVVYDFKNRGIFGYGNDDTVHVITLPGLSISLKEIFEE